MSGSFSNIVGFVKAMRSQRGDGLLENGSNVAPRSPKTTKTGGRRATAPASRAVATLAAVTVLAVSILLLSTPVQALNGEHSLAFDARIATDSGAEVLTIAAGEDTVNLGEKAVPLGELKEKPRLTKDESEAARESKDEGSLDSKLEKRKSPNINITIGDKDYGDGKDVVKFGEDIEVAEGDTIDGDVVAIGGTISVDGTITGDCVSVGGSINLGSTGVIEGDGVSVGGSINREPGSVLQGDEVVTGGHIPKWLLRGGWPTCGKAGLKICEFAFAVGKALLILFIVWLIALIARNRVKVTSERAKSSLLKSFGIGLLIVILLPIAMILLCITIIGIPVAILLPFVIVLAGFFGYTAVGLALGYRIFGGESHGRSVVTAAVLGVLLMEAIPFAGKLIGLPGGILWGLSIPVRIIGYAIMVCAFLIGLGATLLSKFGQVPKAPTQAAVASPGPGAPTVGTAGPVPQAPSVPGYGAPPSG